MFRAFHVNERHAADLDSAYGILVARLVAHHNAFREGKSLSNQKANGSNAERYEAERKQITTEIQEMIKGAIGQSEFTKMMAFVENDFRMRTSRRRVQ